MRTVHLSVLAGVAVCLLAALLALAQGGNSPASTKESGATSGKGMTAAEQTGNGSGEMVEQIKALQKQVLEAILKSDTSVFEKYADDYIAIHGDGKLTTKAEEIENFKSRVTKYESIKVHEAKIRTYGDTAVVNALASVKTIVNGKPYSGDVRNTRVWVKELEFGDAGEDAENQSAIRRRGIHPLVEGDKLDPERVELAQRVHELAQAAGKSVIAVDHDRVHLAPAATSQHLSAQR